MGGKTFNYTAEISTVGPTGKKYDLVSASTYDITTMQNRSVVVKYEEVVETPVTTYTLTVENGTGDGSFEADEQIPITANLAPSDACDEIRTGQVAGEVVVLHDISVTGSYQGSITVSIPVGTEYIGKTLIINHCASGTLEKVTAIVDSNGNAAGYCQHSRNICGSPLQKKSLNEQITR